MKIKKRIVDAIVFISASYIFWDRDTSFMDNFMMQSMFFFIYGLMYIILRG